MKKNQIKYKGYIGSIEWSESDGLFYGQLLGIETLVLYDGKTIEELKEDFHSAVDFYLDSCELNGTEPEKPFSGSFNIRINSKIHKLAVDEAYDRGISLNTIVNEALKAYLM